MLSGSWCFRVSLMLTALDPSGSYYVQNSFELAVFVREPTFSSPVFTCRPPSVSRDKLCEPPNPLAAFDPPEARSASLNIASLILICQLSFSAWFPKGRDVVQVPINFRLYYFGSKLLPIFDWVRFNLLQ